jgi:ABC-type Mn2+/Zn2+ transport system permease subunit
LTARLQPKRKEASLAAFYLVSLALGVMIVSARGSNVDLTHVLFGTDASKQSLRVPAVKLPRGPHSTARVRTFG